METKVIVVDKKDEKMEEILFPAIELLKQGQVVAFPTETVYGLGANALDSSAVSKIFEAKGRPSDNPLIVHISSMEMLKELVGEEGMPKEESAMKELCNRFWPGPITFLFPKSSAVPSNVTAGQPTVAVRMPSHPIARELIRLSNVPIAAPSANVSGRPSPTQALHVLQDLQGKIPCLIDGGSANYGVESTVVDMNRNPPLILRPGGITLEQLREIVPEIQVYEKTIHGSELADKPATPGLKYRHYSPMAPVLLFEVSNTNSLQFQLIRNILLLRKEGKKIGLIHTQSEVELDASWKVIKEDSELEEETKVVVLRLGSEENPQEIAHGIFAAFRELDKHKVDIILVEGISEKNEGMAVMNRIRKAASEVIYCK